MYGFLAGGFISFGDMDLFRGSPADEV